MGKSFHKKQDEKAKNQQTGGRADINKTLEELQAYRLQLEMQNQQLEKAHHELNGLQEKYKKLFEATPAGIIVLDSENTILECNEKAAGLLESTVAAIQGKKISNYVAPGHQDNLYLFLNKLHKTGKAETTALTTKKERGNKLLKVNGIKETLSGGEDIIIIGAMDISREEKQREEHQRQESIYRTLVQNIPGTSIYLVDSDYQIVAAEGDQSRQMLAEEGRAMDGNIFDYVQKSNEGKLNTLLRLAFENKSSSAEFTVDRDILNVQVVPVEKQSGLVESVILIVSKITEEKRNEEKLRQAKEEAERHSRAKSDFLANLSHEIRTPLNSVMGFARQLGKTHLDEEQKHYLELMRRSSDQLHSLIKDFLSISKIESGSMEIEQVQFNLADAIYDIYNMYQEKCKKKGLELEIDIPEDIDRAYVSDIYKIKQALINLMDNALKFTEHGYIRLKARGMEDSRDMSRIQISVEDSGIGISIEKQEQIFKQYQQAEATTSREYGGTGLGLSISRKLIELLGGHTAVHSSPGHGSTFTVELPLKKADKNNRANRASGKLEIEKLKELKVLIADDDELNQIYISNIMDRHGIAAHYASNGQEALDMAQKETYELILLDIRMPKLSGTEVSQAIRNANGPCSMAKIIALTANVLEGDREKYMAAGMDDVLMKPYTEEDLLALMCKLTEASKEDEEKAYNTQALLQATRHDRDLTRKLIKRFVENTREALAALHKALDEGDYQTIGEVSHRMINSFRQLEIHEGAELLSLIEEACLNSGKQAGVPGLLARVFEISRKAIQGLEKEI